MLHYLPARRESWVEMLLCWVTGLLPLGWEMDNSQVQSNAVLPWMAEHPAVLPLHFVKPGDEAHGERGDSFVLCVRLSRQPCLQVPRVPAVLPPAAFPGQERQAGFRCWGAGSGVSGSRHSSAPLAAWELLLQHLGSQGVSFIMA